MTLQLLVSANLDNLGSFYTSLAAVIALIIPVMTTIPTREERIAVSLKARKSAFVAVVVALFLSWIIFGIVGMSSGFEFLLVLAGLALLSATTVVWVIIMSVHPGKNFKSGLRKS